MAGHAGGNLIAPCFTRGHAVSTTNKFNPSSDPKVTPRDGSPEKWLALAGFVVVTMSAVVLFAGPVRGSGAGEQPLIESIRGDNLYKAYCASCHGEDAKGKGPMAPWLKVQPADLTRIAARNGGKFPLERVDRIISGEEALPSGHGTRVMPVWGPVFSRVTRDQDLGRLRIDNLARYLRDIQGK
jgi:mono/diheme cytochrome c family protein